MRLASFQLLSLVALPAFLVQAQNDSLRPTVPTELLSSLASATDTSVKNIPSIIATGTDSVGELGSALTTASGSTPMETADITSTNTAAESASTSEAAAAKVGTRTEDTMMIGIGSLVVAVIIGALGL